MKYAWRSRNRISSPLKRLASVSLFGLASVAATPAVAAIVFVEYSGVVTSGTDGGAIFGERGVDLAGQIFTAKYLFSTSFNGHKEVSDNSEHYYGGIEFGYDGPGLGATLTVGGHTIAIGADYASEVYGTPIRRYSFSGSGPQMFLFNDVIGTTFPGSLSIDFTTSALRPNVTEVFYSPSTLLYLRSNAVSGGFISESPSNVPEIDTWITVLMGVGAIGALKRNRRGNSLNQPALPNLSHFCRETTNGWQG